MNKADYQITAIICSILGFVFVIIGIIIEIMKASRCAGLDTCIASSIYAYSPLFVFGGIILVVIGLGFFWRSARANQEK